MRKFKWECGAWRYTAFVTLSQEVEDYGLVRAKLAPVLAEFGNMPTMEQTAEKLLERASIVLSPLQVTEVRIIQTRTAHAKN
jgi:hypothetical protein